jgi:hypothetical protein
MPLPVSLCLFASTPNIAELGFVVKVLMASIDELPKIAVEWGTTESSSCQILNGSLIPHCLIRQSDRQIPTVAVGFGP